jgi:hypothetical protein
VPARHRSQAQTRHSDAIDRIEDENASRRATGGTIRQ